MRRGLSPDDLGDLFERPIAAILSPIRPDGTILSRPVWHRFEHGRFVFQIPAGDRKIAMLERDPRVTLLLAEDEFPYRGIEWTPDGRRLAYLDRDPGQPASWTIRSIDAAREGPPTTLVTDVQSFDLGPSRQPSAQTGGP